MIWEDDGENDDEGSVDGLRVARLYCLQVPLARNDPLPTKLHTTTAIVKEKTLQLHSLESEKSLKDASMKDDLSSSIQLVNTLKIELEKRLNDLTTIRTDRDTLLQERDDQAVTIDELRKEAAKNDALFKKTLENDRSKMKQELLSRCSPYINYRPLTYLMFVSSTIHSFITHQNVYVYSCVYHIVNYYQLFICWVLTC